jgi:hypothetical protein
MSNNVNLNKNVFDKNEYKKIINNDFTQLINNNSIDNIETIDEKIQKFFQLYNELFYVINQNDDTNSHKFLIKQSSEYINYNYESDTINALLEEINQLKQEIIDINNTSLS